MIASFGVLLLRRRPLNIRRLWGDHGQQDLEAAKVCLINGSAVGTETLKNLVLPGNTNNYLTNFDRKLLQKEARYFIILKKFQGQTIFKVADH